MAEKRIVKIGFYGKMGSGKTTAALQTLGLLSERYGTDNAVGYVITFAQPIKHALLAMHRNAKGHAERVFMQRLGDLARREFGDDVFERIFRENYEGLITNKLPTIEPSNVVIMCDDLRFAGEYNLLRDLGFCIIKIDATETNRQQRIGEAFTNIRHRSEVEQEQFEPDFVINNDGDELALEAHLQYLIQHKNLFGDSNG